MTDTYIIQIGNSDDKLTQKEWSEFVSDIGDIVFLFSKQVHFFGTSNNENPWQNACWVFEGSETYSIERLRDELILIADEFRQDSIALTVGKTELIK